MQFDGNLIQLTERLRRHPEEAKTLNVHEFVHAMVEKWRTDRDLIEVSEEVPQTAWVVRRKVEMLLPAPKPPPEDPMESAPDPDARRDWVTPAVATLKRAQAEALRYHFRPRSSQPPRFRPIRGRQIGELPLAWPKLKRRISPPPTRVYREVDPVGARLRRWQEWLSREEPARFPPPDWPREEVVRMFIALLTLWSNGEVVIDQAGTFNPLEVWRGGE